MTRSHSFRVEMPPHTQAVWANNYSKALPLLPEARRKYRGNVRLREFAAYPAARQP